METISLVEFFILGFIGINMSLAGACLIRREHFKRSGLAVGDQ